MCPVVIFILSRKDSVKGRIDSLIISANFKRTIRNKGLPKGENLEKNFKGKITTDDKINLNQKIKPNPKTIKKWDVTLNM